MSAILGFYVNALDSAFEDPDLGAVASGLDHAGLFLYADDLSDNAADRRDLIADLKIVAHVCNLLVLLFLLTRAYDHEYDHNTDYEKHGEHGEKSAGCIFGSRC